MRWREGRSGPCTSSCASSRLVFGRRRSRSSWFCTVRKISLWGSYRRRTCGSASSARPPPSNQLSLVVLHVLDERASGVVGAED